jgi:hypothetical protein
MTTNTEREPFVDAEEAGKFLCLRPRRVMDLARQGELPAYPLGQVNGGCGVFGCQSLRMPSAHAV